MRNRAVEDGVSLLGGALVGAAVMYFLDPEVGRRRREAVARRTNEAMHETTGALGTGLEAARGAGLKLVERAGDASSAWTASLADRARNLSSNVSSAFGEHVSQARDAGADAADHVKGWGGNVSDYAHDLMDRARYLGRHARGRSDAARRAVARSIAPSEHEVPVGALAATGVATLLTGAGLMYLFDPERGRGRRAHLVGKCNHIVRETGTAFNRTGRHLMNRLRGTAHAARSRFSAGDAVSGEQLMERVRASIGRVVSRPADVQLVAEDGGSITLYGRVPASEADKLLHTVNNVRGVCHVINRLEVQDITPGASPQQGQAVPQM